MREPIDKLLKTQSKNLGANRPKPVAPTPAPRTTRPSRADERTPLAPTKPAVQESVAKSIVPKAEQQGLDGDALVARAKKLVGKNEFDGQCQGFVEAMSGWSDPAGSAKESYQEALKGKYLQNTTDYSKIPAGAQLYFTGNKKWGHTALASGSGKMYTTGIGGKVVEMPIADLAKTWGNSGTFLGYSTKYGDQSLRPGYEAPHQAAPLEGAPKAAPSIPTTPDTTPIALPKTDNPVNYSSSAPMASGKMFGTQPINLAALAPVQRINSGIRSGAKPQEFSVGATPDINTGSTSNMPSSGSTPAIGKL